MSRQYEYDNDAITSLKGPDRVRLRPGVIFGSDDIQGAQHAFFEILSNSIDEAREGHGREIRVFRYRDGSLEVQDDGRGIPLDYNSREGRFNWELVYCELYAGGKYNTLEGENYEFSLGLNGLGACATQYASAEFSVDVRRDGYQYHLDFKRGEPIGELQKVKYSGRDTGTSQRFRLDRDVFTDTDIPFDWFDITLKRQSIVNQGVRFVFQDEITEETVEYIYPEGVLGYLKELNGDQGIVEPITWLGEGEGQDRFDRPVYKVKAEFALVFNNEVAVKEFYHNSSYLEYGGSPEKAVRSALTGVFDRFAKQEDKYKGKEERITFPDVEDSLIIIINSFSTQTSYENQTKKAINNKFIQQFLTEQLKNQLEVWTIENRTDALKILDQILVNKRVRESAEKQRVQLKKNLMGQMDMTNRVKKFVDCRSKDLTRRELYIVEGDSALGSVKMGRDAEFQAVIPVRGKILNCLKADLTAIFNNDIIMDLVKVLGCGIDAKSNKSKGKGVANFDLDQLRWSKVIICTDADVDGFQIRTLILAMFYRLMPGLLDAGKVHIAETPLFEINIKKGRKEKTFFAYDEVDKNKLIQEHGAENTHIQRSKGLGENEPDMMWATTMNPQTRRLIQVKSEDDVRMMETFDLLLGDNLPGRKLHIAENGHLWMDMLDVV